MKHKDAKMFKQLSYMEVLNKDLKVMDATAISLCREGKIPIIVFNMFESGNIYRIIMGEDIGSVVKE